MLYTWIIQYRTSHENQINDSYTSTCYLYSARVGIQYAANIKIKYGLYMAQYSMAHQDFKFDWNADITGMGSRSLNILEYV